MASEFQSFLEDLFAPLGGVSLRRMFGGIGIFHEGVMFALVVDDVLYLKTDETTLAAYAAEGCAPWATRARTMYRSRRPIGGCPSGCSTNRRSSGNGRLPRFGVAERAQGAARTTEETGFGEERKAATAGPDRVRSSRTGRSRNCGTWPSRPKGR